MYQMCCCLLAEIFMCPNFSESWLQLWFFCKQKESGLPLSFLAWQLVWGAWNNCYAELAFTFQPISPHFRYPGQGGIATTCHHMLHPKKTTTIYNFSKSSLAVMCCTAALIQTHSFPIHFLHIQMVVGCSTNSSLLTTVVVTAHNTEQEEYLLHELVGWCCWWWWYYQRLLEPWTGVLEKVNNWTTTQNARLTIGQYILAPTESRMILHCNIFLN